MEIKDNGKGFDVNRTLGAKRHKLWGRLGIPERVEPVRDSAIVASAPVEGATLRAPSIDNAAIALGHQERIRPHLTKKLISMVAGSTSRLGRIADYPIGASLCLALGYMILCSAYIFFSGRIAASAAWSVDQLRDFELLKGLAFVIITGAGYFAFAAFLLKRISIQQQHLALIFQSVSDCLFLLQVEADDTYRFVCVNAAFLKLTGLTHEQINGKRVEEVLPGTPDAPVRSKCQEAIRERKTVNWEGIAAYPASQIVGDISLTPLADKSGALVQLAGVIRDVTERKQVEDEVRHLSGHLLRSRDDERRRIGRELHDSTAQELMALSMNLDLVQHRNAGRDATTDNLLADSQAIIEQSQRELRTMAYQLHPPSLDELGLAGAVEEYAAGFTQRSGIKVTLDLSPTLGRLSAETERALFRVVQETLGNVHRHSGSPTATIRITRDNGAVILEVSDQGCGLRFRSDGTVAKAGVGLAGMRERVRQLGGRFEVQSSGRGTTVRASVPEEVVADEVPANPDRR